MADGKQVLVLEFVHRSDSLKLDEVIEIITRDQITVSRSREFAKNKAFPVINVGNSANSPGKKAEQSPSTLVIKVAGTTSAVIAFK